MPVAARGGGDREVAKHRLGVEYAVAVGAVDGAVQSPAVEQLDELHPAGQLLQPEVADPVGVTHAGKACVAALQAVLQFRVGAHVEVLHQNVVNHPKNGSRPRALNREVVIIVQHGQRRSCRSGSPGG
jgi:hypothetical protein